MRRYLCTIQEVEENAQRTKRRRLDPTLNEVDAGRSGLQQQWINQRQQHVPVEPRTIQNTRRGKNMRLNDTSEHVAEYLEKQIRRSNQILAKMEVDNKEIQDNYEDSEQEIYDESEDSEEDMEIWTEENTIPAIDRDSDNDMEVPLFDDKDNEEEYFYSEIRNNRVKSENNIKLDEYGKPNSEMLEIMARKQQRLAQKKGQSQRTPSQLKYDKPELSSLAATVVGPTQNRSEPMEIDIVPKGRRSIRTNQSKFGKPELNSSSATTIGQIPPQKHSGRVEVNMAPKGRRSIREKINSNVSQDSSNLTPAMKEILARKQQTSKPGPTKKLDQTVSSTTELASNIPTNSQQIGRGTRLGRKSIRNDESGVSNINTSIKEMVQQIESVALKKGRSKSLQQPDTTVHVIDKEPKTHNVSVNKDKCVTEDVGKLTPAMQEILARKQQKFASKQGQDKKLDQLVSSTTENIAVVKVEQLSPKVTLEYSRSLEMETKTTTYSTSSTENIHKPASGMQKVMIQKQQQDGPKSRKSRKLDQTTTSTVETSSAKLIPVQIHIEPEMKTRRKSTRQPQPNASGAGDSLYHKPQEENKDLQKEHTQDQSDIISENTSKMTPAMKAIMAQKQQKEAASKQGINKKLNQTVTSTTETVLNTSTKQSSIQLNVGNKSPAENKIKSGGKPTRKSQAEKSRLEIIDNSTQEKQQTLNESAKKGRGKKVNQTVSSTSSLSEPGDDGSKPRGKRIRKEVTDVYSTTKAEEERSVNVESKTVSARGKRTISALSKESNENSEINLNNVSEVRKEQKIEKEVAKRGKKSIARSEDLNTTQILDKPTPAMQALLAKKQQRALGKSTKGKK